MQWVHRYSQSVVIISLALLNAKCEKLAQQDAGVSDRRSPRTAALTVTSSGNDESSGAVLSIPPDLANLAGQLRIEEGAAVATQTVAAALNIGEGGLTQSGPSVNISAQSKVDASQIGRLEISIPFTEAASLALASTYLVVVYQVIDADGKVLVGVIPPADFKADAGLVKFKLLGFGNYQAVRVATEIKESIKVQTEETKIVTKQEQAALPPLTVAGINPIIVYKGGKVSISGSNFRSGIKLAYLGRPLTQVNIQSDQVLTVVIDEAPRRGRGMLYLAQDGIERSMSLAYAGTSSDFPLMTLEPADVCAGQKYYNANGDLLEGSKVCTAAPATVKNCSSSGEVDCLANASFKAADVNGLAAKVLSGHSVAGVDGSVTLPPVNKVLSGTSFGAAGALTGTLTLPSAGKVLTGTNYGVGGTATTGTLNLPDPSNVKTGSGAYGDADAQLTPSYTPDFPSLANVRSSDTVDGTSGALADCTAANQSGCVATVNYKTMNLSSAGTATGLTSSNFQTTIASASSFEFWDASGTRQTVTGSATLVAGNIKNGVSIFGVSGQYPSASFPLASNTAATDLTNFITQMTTEGAFEFFDSTGAMHTGSGDADLSNVNIKKGVALENLSITGDLAFKCPANYVRIPGDQDYGTNDFCIMKVEAKNVSNVATSQIASAPWASISQAASLAQCRSLGLGYDLINNAEWMTAGSNIAGKGANWTSGTVGTGSLFVGHSDYSPSSACPASADETLAFVESNCTPINAGGGSNQKRVFMLSTNDVVWDIVGNVAEWVNYSNYGDKPSASTWTEYNSITATITAPLVHFIPTHAVKSFWVDTWQHSTTKIGMLMSGTNLQGGALIRGGDYMATAYAGLFSANLSLSPTSTANTDGFRCVYRAPNP